MNRVSSPGIVLAAGLTGCQVWGKLKPGASEAETNWRCLHVLPAAAFSWHQNLTAWAQVGYLETRFSKEGLYPINILSGTLELPNCTRFLSVLFTDIICWPGYCGIISPSIISPTVSLVLTISKMIPHSRYSTLLYVPPIFS